MLFVFADSMSGLGPDMSALTLLSQANLAAVLNKVRSNLRIVDIILFPWYADTWEEAAYSGVCPDEAIGQGGQDVCSD